MDATLTSLLVCPLCHAPLAWSDREERNGELLRAEARCPSCDVRSRVRDGVGLFLPGDAPEELGPDPLEGSEPEPLRPLFGDGRLPPSVRAIVEAVAGRVLLLDPSAPAALLPQLPAGPRPLIASGRPAGFADLRRAHPERTPWDAIGVEPHSLPLADRSFGGAVIDPALASTPGPLVILRELRRVVRGPLLAPVTFLERPAAADLEWIEARGWRPLLMAEEARALLRKARWTVRSEELAERTVLPGGEFPRHPLTVRSGWLRAD